MYWNNSDFADCTDLQFSRTVYFPFRNFSIMCAEHAVRQRHQRNIRTPTWSCTLHVLSFGTKLATAISDCTKRTGSSWEEGSMPKLVRDASELRGGRRISFGDICAAQTRYIARGCPLLDVIGHSLTSTVDGKFIGRPLPSSERVSWVTTNLEEMRRVRPHTAIVYYH